MSPKGNPTIRKERPVAKVTEKQVYEYLHRCRYCDEYTGDDITTPPHHVSGAGQERKTRMKINYGIRELCKTHENMIHIVNGVDTLTTEWLACGAFLAEAYELEVTKHGGLDADKIKEYKSLCCEFLHRNDETM